VKYIYNFFFFFYFERYIFHLLLFFLFSMYNYKYFCNCSKRCIEKWLASPKNQRCPNCNSKAQKKDIRLVVPAVLIAHDTLENEKAVELLSEERKKTNEARQEAAKWRVQFNKVKAEKERIRDQLEYVMKEKAEYEFWSFYSCHSTSSSLLPPDEVFQLSNSPSPLSSLSSLSSLLFLLFKWQIIG